MDYKDLEEVCLAGCSAIELFADAKQGIVKEGAHLVQFLKRMPAAVKDANKAWDEYLTLGDAEKEQLKAKVAADFDIVDDAAEALVEMGISLLVDLNQAVAFFVPKTPPETPKAA